MAGRYGGAVMMTLSYAIWIYLISYSGSIISTMIARFPVFSGVNSTVSSDVIFTVISTLIGAALNVIAGMFVCGIDLYYLNLSTGRDPQTGDIFRGFRGEPSKVFTISGFLLLPSLIFSIPFNVFASLYMLNEKPEHLVLALIFFGASMLASLYMHLTYGTAFFFMLDFPNYSVSKTLSVTRKKMTGHRFRLFLLDLRFFPLIILGALSFGIGFLWIHPLITECHTLFFLNLMNPGHYIPIDERI